MSQEQHIKKKPDFLGQDLINVEVNHIRDHCRGQIDNIIYYANSRITVAPLPLSGLDQKAVDFDYITLHMYLLSRFQAEGILCLDRFYKTLHLQFRESKYCDLLNEKYEDLKKQATSDSNDEKLVLFCALLDSMPLLWGGVLCKADSSWQRLKQFGENVTPEILNLIIKCSYENVYSLCHALIRHIYEDKLLDLEAISHIGEIYLKEGTESVTKVAFREHYPDDDDDTAVEGGNPIKCDVLGLPEVSDPDPDLL